MQWFRWHRNTAGHPKFAVIAAEANNTEKFKYDDPDGENGRRYGAVTVTDVVAVWAVMLECAADDDAWGVCTKNAKYIAATLRWWPDEVQSVLDAFTNHGLIEPDHSGHRIVNWDKYQYVSDKDPTNAERQRRYRARQSQGGSRITDAKRVSNALPKRPDTETDTDTEKTPPRPPSLERGNGRGTRLPDDWTPDEACRRYAQGLGLEPDRVSEDFRDYWHAAAGSKAVKRDWSATWRTWCRREAERARRPNPPSRPGVGSTIEAVRRLKARLATDGCDGTGRPVRNDGPNTGNSGGGDHLGGFPSGGNGSQRPAGNGRNAQLVGQASLVDDAPERGNGRNRGADSGLRGDAGGLPGGHRPPRSENASEDVQVVSGVAGNPGASG